MRRLSSGYDPGNRPIEEIDAFGGYAKSVYDSQTGKLVSTIRGKYLIDETTGKLVVDPTTNEYAVDTSVTPQTWLYEYEGSRTTVTDPLGRKTTSVQDKYYLPVETIYRQRDGRDYSTTTSYLYDNNLQEAKDYPTRIVDIGGNDRVFTYDEFGRLETATDLGDEIYQYNYGDSGLELIQSPTSVTTTGEIRETRTYGYDDLGNLNRMTYGDGSSKLMSYRPTDNRLGTVTLPNGETIEYEYEEGGQVKSETTKAADGTVINTVSYSYEDGAIKTMTDDTGTTTYHYDSLTGGLSEIEYPNGSSIAYTYDLLGRTKTIAEKTSLTSAEYVTEYGYDAFGNLETVKDPSGGVTTMRYDVLNRLEERQLPNGVTTVYEYDELDRVESIVHTNGDGEVLASVSYERSGIGEPTKIVREDGSYVLLEYDEGLRVTKESFYDAAGELVDELSYDYDAAGKRMVQSSMSGGDRSFNYTAGYQLDGVESVSQTEDYDYDENGRLTLIDRDGEVLDLEHDGGDRLREVENQTTGEVVEYGYDGRGQRVSASDGEEVRQFLVAPAMGSGLESADLMSDGDGNLISNFVYAGGATPFMRLDENGNPIYYLMDGMGTVIGLADGEGQEVADLRYDSFGNLRSGDGRMEAAMGGDFRFQGQWLESESGLYYFRARDYDSKTGLFLSRDPVDIIETEPESFNPYQFVYNNPHVFSDPTGMFTITELNATVNMHSTLLRTHAKEFAVDFVKERVGEVTGNLLNGVINRLLPTTTMGEHFNSIVDLKGSGPKFEKYITGQVCGLLYGVLGSYADRVWIEASIHPETGVPNGNGISCDLKINTKGKGIPDWPKRGRGAKPDFLDQKWSSYKLFS